MLHRDVKSGYVSKYNRLTWKIKIFNSYSAQDFVKVEMTPPHKDKK